MIKLFLTTSLIENNRNLMILIFNVDGFLRELWGSAEMEMNEEYSSKRRMQTGMRIILIGGELYNKVFIVRSPSR
jgi:hypothetical protein